MKKEKRMLGSKIFGARLARSKKHQEREGLVLGYLYGVVRGTQSSLTGSGESSKVEAGRRMRTARRDWTPFVERRLRQFGSLKSRRAQVGILTDFPRTPSHIPLLS